MIDNLPTLDLHGMDSVTSKIRFNEFVKDNIILKNRELLVVHGVGLGIIRDVIKEEAKNNKNVIKSELDIFNSGVTRVFIDIKEKK